MLAAVWRAAQIPEMADEKLDGAETPHRTSPSQSGSIPLVQLTLLGDARLSTAGTAWTGRAAQSRRMAVLAGLACASSRRMTRSSLQALMWPDADVESARRLLNESVYVIRRELGSDILESRGEYLGLGPGLYSDVESFRSAIQANDPEGAIRLYTGPLLGSWSPEGMPEFERWAALERETLSRQHRDCLLRLAVESHAAGDWARAAERYQQLLAVDRFSVQAAMGLARSLATGGEPLQAVRVIDAMSNEWREEFGEKLPSSLAAVRDELLATPAVVQPKLVAGVRRPVVAIPEPTDRGTAVIESISTIHTAEFTPSQAPALRAGVRSHWLAIGALLLMTLTLSAFWFSRQEKGLVHRQVSHIAIAPFEIAPADSDLAYVATGLGESLAGALGSLTGLRLVAPEALARAGGTIPPLDSIARRFGEPFLLRGTVEAARGEVMVTVRIIDSKTGEQMASSVTTASRNQLESLRHELVAMVAVAVRQRLGFTNERSVYEAWTTLGVASAEGVEMVWRAQHRIGALVAERLSTEIDTSAFRRMQRTGDEADSLLARAETMNARWAEPALLRARLAWERARLEVGPSRLTEAVVGIGHTERTIAMLEATATGQLGESGALAKTLQRAQLAHAYFLRGTLRLMTGVAMATWRDEDALVSSGERDLMRAVELDSMHASAWAGLARPRWMRADYAGAFEAAQAAVRVDPYGKSLEESIRWAAHSAAALGQRDDALRWCRRGRIAVPSSWLFVDCELATHSLDAAGLGDTPDPKAAWALVDTLERLDPNAVEVGRPYSPIYRRLVASAVSAAAGDTVTARRELQRAFARVAGHEDLETDILYDAAFVHATLGDRRLAAAELERYGKARPGYARGALNTARFRSLRIGSKQNP